MIRFAQRATALALLAAISLGSISHAAPITPAVAAGSHAHLDAALLTSDARAGGQARLFVHAPAASALTLAVAYAGGGSATYRGLADSRGRYIFVWSVPRTAEGIASLDLSARRGSLAGSWTGTLAVGAVPLPPLFVAPVAPRVEAGTALGIFVHTSPFAAIHYRMVADDGTPIASGVAESDARGRYTIGDTDPYLPRHPIAVTATVAVTTADGTRTRVARFLLTPRPALPLFVSPLTRSLRAGDPLSVFVSSAPATAISVTVALRHTVVAAGSGHTDAHGRWVFTTNIYATLSQASAARVRVLASRGIDRASAAASFMVRPGAPGIPDRLASPSNPTPRLGAFLPETPDKVILISTESQTLRAYAHGALAYETYVTTGRPELPTVHGVFHVYEKVTPFTFISPWAYGSPYYYPPSPVDWWMPFYGGYGIHDAPWRRVYGPGTNLPHYDSDPGEPVGSHGCVNVPHVAMAWLWNWAAVGTTVVVY